MHLELVDVLRCPRQHAPSVLIATIDRIGGRSVERGALGCPICDARFDVIDGALVFEPRHYAERRAAKAIGPAAPDRVEWAAALLGLADPGGLVLLGGDASGLAASLHEIADVSVILHNPPGPVAGWDAVTPIYADRVPLAPGVLRGAIIDVSAVDTVSDVVRALRLGGRLIAPVGTPVPDGVQELARDGDVWVAERRTDVASDPVPLRRVARAHPSS